MTTRLASRRAVSTVAVLSTMFLTASARADTASDWNALATDELVADGQGGSALVQLAMVHGAMYDAVNAIDRRHEPYLVEPAAQPFYSREAAAATAAFRVLVDSRPSVVQPAREAQLVAAARRCTRHRWPGSRPGPPRTAGSRRARRPLGR